MQHVYGSSVAGAPWSEESKNISADAKSPMPAFVSSITTMSRAPQKSSTPRTKTSVPNMTDVPSTIPRPEEIVWTCQRAPLPPQLAGRVPDAVWAATFDAVAQRVAEDNEMRVRALNTLGGPMIPCCVCCRVCTAFASVGKIQEEQQRSDQAWLALAQGEQAKYAPYGVHVALATETRVSGGDDTRVRTREVNVGLKFEAADPVDGVVVEAPALQEPIERAGIASELEALVALHQKGALTDGEFAAAKAKLLG